MSYIRILIVILLLSCKGNETGIDSFKTGSFETFLEDTNERSLAYRNDSLQIEIYDGKKDTFAIEWKSNFEYILTKLHPTNELDSTPFIVKITGIKDNAYTFKAYYKGSNFKQKGKAVKLKK